MLRARLVTGVFAVALAIEVQILGSWAQETELQAPAVQPLTNQFPLSAVEDAPRRLRRADTAEERLGFGHPPLRLFSQLEAGAVISSNADRAADGVDEDFGVFLAPELRLQSNWSRHALDLRAAGEGAYFATSDEVDIDSFSLSGDLRLDVRRITRVDFDAAYSASRNSVDTRELDQQASGGAALSHDFGLMEGRVRAGAVVFMPGEDGDQKYIEPSFSVRGTLNTHGMFLPFFEASYQPRLIKNERDSQGASVSAGFAFANEPFISGEIAGVYAFQIADDIDQAFGVRGNAVWTPTDFTAFTLETDVELADKDSRQWSGQLDVSHQFTDEISLTAGGAATITSIEDAKDRIALESNAGITWAFNPYFAWSLRYENLFVVSDDKTQEHRAIASIILRR